MEKLKQQAESNDHQVSASVDGVLRINDSGVLFNTVWFY